MRTTVPTMAELRRLRRAALEAAGRPHDETVIAQAAVDALDAYEDTVRALGFDPLDQR